MNWLCILSLHFFLSTLITNNAKVPKYHPLHTSEYEIFVEHSWISMMSYFSLSAEQDIFMNFKYFISWYISRFRNIHWLHKLNFRKIFFSKSWDYLYKTLKLIVSILRINNHNRISWKICSNTQMRTLCNPQHELNWYI